MHVNLNTLNNVYGISSVDDCDMFMQVGPVLDHQHAMAMMLCISVTELNLPDYCII